MRRSTGRELNDEESSLRAGFLLGEPGSFSLVKNAIEPAVLKWHQFTCAHKANKLSSGTKFYVKALFGAGAAGKWEGAAAFRLLNSVQTIEAALAAGHLLENSP